MLGPYHADIFQNGDLKYFQVATTPLPVPSDFDGLPYPHVSGTPGFFHQNDRKGCKRDYLDARGPFVLRFGAIREKPLMGGNHHPPPLERRSLRLKKGLDKSSILRSQNAKFS